jgi:tetratricopeptide (TPR) repeat protein
MPTFISSHFGKAVIIRGTNACLIDVDHEVPSIEVSLAEAQSFFRASADLREIAFTSESKIRGVLQVEYYKDRALSLALFAIDPDLSVETRTESVPLADELLREPEVSAYVLNMLHAAVLPNETAFDAESFDPRSAIVKIFVDVQRNRHAIELVCGAWDALSDRLFEGQEQERATVRSVAARAGIFRKLANAITDSSSVIFDSAKFDALMLLKDTTGYRDIVGQWFAPLSPKEKAPKLPRSILPEEDDEADTIELATQQRVDPGLKAHEAYERVKLQMPAIKSSIAKLKIDAARRFTKQLVNDQLGNDDSEYAARTLCNVASTALECFQYSFGVELAQQATQVRPEDHVTWAVLSEGLLRQHRYDAALEALQRCKIAGGEHYAASGIGRVLRHQGRLEEARLVLEDVIQEKSLHPDLWHSYLVLGEIYRDLHEYESAAQLYEKALSSFPKQPEILCGKGHLLRETGQLAAAIELFKELPSIDGHRREIYTGLLDCLIDAGHWDEAEQSANQGCRRFPDEPLLFSQKGYILRLRGRRSEAMNVYQFMQQEFPYSYAGIRGHIDSLGDLKRFKEALALVEVAKSQFPFEPGFWLSEATFYRQMGQKERSLQVLGNARNAFPNHVGLQLGTAETLKHIGDVEEASRRYEDMAHKAPAALHIKIALASTYLAQGMIDKALSLLPQQRPRTKTEWVAYHVRGMAALKAGNVSRAMEIFEDGAATVPFAKQRDYFTTALALAKVAGNRADEIPADLKIPDSPVSNVIQFHVYAAKRDNARAQVAFTALTNTCPPLLIPIRDEIAARYGFSSRRPKHDAAWLIGAECSVLTLSSPLDLAA